MARYSPRRQSKRWLDEDCPDGVLAIYDNGGKTFDRYTVFYREPVRDGDYATMILGYRGMSEHPFDPQGFGQFGELSAHETASYRYRVSHQAAKWSSLPDDVKRCVRQDCEEFSRDNTA